MGREQWTGTLILYNTLLKAFEISMKNNHLQEYVCTYYKRRVVKIWKKYSMV